MCGHAAITCFSDLPAAAKGCSAVGEAQELRPEHHHYGGVWRDQDQDPQEQITSGRATQVHVPLKGWLSPVYPFIKRKKCLPLVHQNHPER